MSGWTTVNECRCCCCYFCFFLFSLFSTLDLSRKAITFQVEQEVQAQSWKYKGKLFIHLLRMVSLLFERASCASNNDLKRAAGQCSLERKPFKTPKAMKYFHCVSKSISVLRFWTWIRKNWKNSNFYANICSLVEKKSKHFTIIIRLVKNKATIFIKMMRKC